MPCGALPGARVVLASHLLLEQFVGLRRVDHRRWDRRFQTILVLRMD
jgi:hypothetical protein